MAGGLLALLDDVAALARLAASSADDVAAAAGRAGAKTLGVVVDDAAVVPGYVVGLPPQRELPIIGKIIAGSLRNKLIFILPVALLLSAFLPKALTPILMLGGLYLCFEGAEKLLDSAKGRPATREIEQIRDPAELERRQIRSAVRTDLILSSEIMVITLNELGSSGLAQQAVVLAIVGVLVTIVVYGAVALIVKLDDIGLSMMKNGGAASGFGRALVRFVPVLLKSLAVIGMVAMLCVGGGILIHGLSQLGITRPEEFLHAAAHVFDIHNPVVTWFVTTIGSGITGLAVGAILAGFLHLWPRDKQLSI